MSFTLFTIGKTRVRLNALFLIPLIIAFLRGNGHAFLLTLVALMLHEAAHAAMTFACGLQIEEIVLHPLGLCARLAGRTLSFGDELAIAAAGPVFSLTAGVAASLVYHSGLLISDTVLLFGSINTLLAFLNLLPAPPLDGAAALGAFVSGRFSQTAARTALGISGFLSAALMAGASVYLFVRGDNFYVCAIAAVFLAISTLQELLSRRGGRAAAMLKKNAALYASRSVRVREVALRSTATAKEALREASLGEYTRFVVIGEDARELGVLNENDLYEGMARFGSGVTLKSLLAASIDLKRTW